MNLAFVPETIKLFSQAGTARVQQTIGQNQPGRVKYQATYWPAKFYQPDCQATAFPGDSVTVVGRQGITLLVVPATLPT